MIYTPFRPQPTKYRRISELCTAYVTTISIYEHKSSENGHSCIAQKQVMMSAPLTTTTCEYRHLLRLLDRRSSSLCLAFFLSRRIKNTSMLHTLSLEHGHAAKKRNRLNGYLLECMEAQYQHIFSCSDPVYGSIYDIANVVYGAAFKSSLFNEEKNGYPLIRIRDLGTFSPQYWTDEPHPKRTLVQPGDVLAGMDAEFTPCFWQGETAVLNQRVCLFEPLVESGISRSYLFMALKPLLAYIQNYASGTTVAHMGKSDLEALNVSLPAREKLEKFNAIAEPLREQLIQNSKENRELAALRNALLPKLMSGEIDVSKVDLTQLNSHLA